MSLWAVPGHWKICLGCNDAHFSPSFATSLWMCGGNMVSTIPCFCKAEISKNWAMRLFINLSTSNSVKSSYNSASAYVL
eukprot:CAMPEP_0170332454 /NCGR_PEP_ID=MMETSP0116_2-20130129/67230_1 /TAXON_ID=400756 /ORGANISM="Durinskia baltica, Strain CSIRO CS-38" /LENGTH=78 /DNA_ID=CAMNT_0010585763 /DNA_START=305 /DNA_END=541 /DNA_ORIENTATION=+